MKYYLLRGHTPVPCDLWEWMSSYETTDRHVAWSEIGCMHVSTVFLDLDHSFGHSEEPVLFETMIFADGHDYYQSRCSTWEQAEIMHANAVALAIEQIRQADDAIAVALKSSKLN